MAISDGARTRPLMHLHSAIPVLTVMNFHHGLLTIKLGFDERLYAYRSTPFKIRVNE